ncbi:M6 family metalloprotease domain-containing protein, partial [Candidatus Woesearchaeota archaeon]|nr:M6 family metalloprotease domain-containing protein [Candidatus Woesearchaeota archaeon]
KGYNTSDLVLDNVRLSYNTNDYFNDVSVVGYTMLAEDSPVGTFAHEFGHTLGLPDLYNTNTGASKIGDWGIMDHGAWNGIPQGSSPAHFCAWSKYYLGWINPTVINSGLSNISVNQVERNSDVYMLLDSGYSAGEVPDSEGSEYFLVENRQKIGFDAYLPGDGLLIWHIDDSAGAVSSNNVNNGNPRRVDLESADNTDPSSNQGDTGDPWEANAEFNSTSAPNSALYSGSKSNVTVREISISGTTMWTVMGFEGSSADLQPINISVPSPLHYGALDNINLTISNTEDTNATNVLVNLYINGTFDSNQTISNIAGNSEEIVSFQPNLIYGTYDIVFIVDPQDFIFETNETNNNLSKTITINHTAPNVLVTYPNASVTVIGDITITAEVTDADSDAQIIWFFYTDNYNENCTWNLIGNSTFAVNNIYNITWNTTTVSDGNTYRIKVNATDNTSKTAFDVSDSDFKINNINDAPEINLTSPLGGENWSNTQIITWSASDSDQDELTIALYYTTDSNWISMSSNETNDNECNWNVSNLSDGDTYKVKITAYDGNLIANSTSNEFTIDNTEPSVSLNIPDTSITTSDEINITCTASDSESGIKNITIDATDNENDNPVICLISNCSVVYEPDSEGDKKITCTASDFAGNSHSTSSNLTSTTTSNGDDGGDEEGDESSGEFGMAGELGGSWNSKSFAELTPGTKVTWSVPASAGLDLSSVELTSKKAATNVRIKAKKLDSKPEFATTNPAGKVRQYFQMNTDNLPTSDISLITMKFKIPKSWFTANNLDEDSFSIRRWSGKGWSKISTTKSNSDATYVNYKLNTKQFSYFALTALGKEGEAANKTNESGKLGPGKDEPFSKETTAAAAFGFKDIFNSETLGLNNLYWVVIFIGIVCMFVFLLFGVNIQKKKKARVQKILNTSRWKEHLRFK